MALPATSGFTASDGVLPTQITTFSAVRGAMQVRSNKAQTDTQNDETCCRWNADTFNDDQYAEIVADPITSSLYIGASVRCQSGSEGYYGYYEDTGNRYFFKMVGGTFSDLVSPVTGTSNTAPDTLRIEASGTTITAFLNGSQDGSFSTTDSSHASGYGGVCGWGEAFFDTETSGDTWEAGNLGGVAFTPRMSLLGVG